jgi:hypothetical protein
MLYEYATQEALGVFKQAFRQSTDVKTNGMKAVKEGDHEFATIISSTSSST